MSKGHAAAAAMSPPPCARMASRMAVNISLLRAHAPSAHSAAAADDDDDGGDMMLMMARQSMRCATPRRARTLEVRTTPNARSPCVLFFTRVRGDDAHGSVSRTIGVAIDRVIDRGGSVDDDE